MNSHRVFLDSLSLSVVFLSGREMLLLLTLGRSDLKIWMYWFHVSCIFYTGFTFSDFCFNCWSQSWLWPDRIASKWIISPMRSSKLCYWFCGSFTFYEVYFSCSWPVLANFKCLKGCVRIFAVTSKFTPLVWHFLGCWNPMSCFFFIICLAILVWYRIA